MWARLLRRLVDVRPDEFSAVLLACVYFFFLMASYFILRPIRDTMAVAAGISRLPWLWTGTLAAMLVCNPLFAALVVRFPVRRFIIITYQFFAANLLLFWVLFRSSPSDSVADVWLGRAFYVWTAVFNLFVVSVFWCFMADTFRSAQAKRLFGFIGVGGTLGSIAGSAATALLVQRAGTLNLLLISMVLLEIAVLVVAVFPARRIAVAAGSAIDGASDALDQRAIGGDLWAGLTNLLRSPYLMGIALFLLLYVLGNTVLYFEQTDIIGRTFASRSARTEVLAEMEFASQTLTVLVQIFLTGRIIRWIGLGATLAVLPVLSVVGFAAVGASAMGWSVIPLLGTFVAFSVLRRGTNFALTNPAMETLYTVVSREDKYKAKSFIETFVYRAGDQLSAWTYAGLTALGLGLAGIAWAAVLPCVVFLAVGIWLGRRQREIAGSAGQDVPPFQPLPAVAD